MQQKFEYNNLPVRTVTDDNEQIWFAGIDICNILGYAKASTTIERLEEDEKKLEYLTDTSGQQRKTWSINEFGLYSLILSSTKPEAKVFKRWVTHEVLPAIRKAGKFTTEEVKEYEYSLQTLASEIEKLKDKKDEHQKCVNDLKKEIELKTLEMIAVIKMDRSQMRIEFPEA
ncbi:MAG TPA: BRO family protein [Paludibacteraceae bacterium]|nr:BRO family protein [Paludibacteraceae bacterium]